jgi:hypothetical protein
MRTALQRAIEVTGTPGGGGGGGVTPGSSTPASSSANGGKKGGSGGGGGDVFKLFWSAHQRFFKLLCVSLKIPTVVEEVRR